jgi:TolB protein
MVLLGLILAIAAPAVAAEPRSLSAVQDSYPDPFPDGRLILFHSNRSGRQALWIAGVDGTSPRIFFDDPSVGTNPGTPDWSPDGRTIVFAMTPRGATDENESEIYLIDAEGVNLRRLTDAPGDDSHPRWSQSGRIFFNSARATPDLKADWSRQWIDIYSMRPDGSDLRKHSDCRSVCTYPAPSPDGRYVAHRRTTDTTGQNWDLSAGTRNSEVFVTPLDGSAPVNVSSSPAYDGWPTWSPDGKWVVFTSNRDTVAYTGQLYAVSPDGKKVARLTEGTWSRAQPSFAADGERIFVYESIENADFELGHITVVPFEPPD